MLDLGSAVFPQTVSTYPSVYEHFSHRTGKRLLHPQLSSETRGHTCHSAQGIIPQTRLVKNTEREHSELQKYSLEAGHEDAHLERHGLRTAEESRGVPLDEWMVCPASAS